MRAQSCSSRGHDDAIDVRSELPLEQFEREYLLPRRPVILTDAVSDWKALSKWSPEHLLERIGDKRVPFRGHSEHQDSFRVLSENIAKSLPENPAVYVENVDIRGSLPELLDDVTPRIRYAGADWKASRLMPKDWLFPSEMEALFYGGRGSRLPDLHYDYYGLDAFISQIYGEKEFLVFAPHDTPYLYPRADDPLRSALDDFDAPDPERFPLFRRATPIRFTLSAGETLYVPNRWWHTTRMHCVSLTVITTSWNKANWNRFTAEVLREAWSRRRVRWLAFVPYMYLVGLFLRARDARSTRNRST